MRAGPRNLPPGAARALTRARLRQGGVPKKHQDSLRREVLHTYGHEYLGTLTLLQSAGARRCSGCMVGLAAG
jgi:hypothetical protein